MKTRLLCVISLLLLSVSCQVEQQELVYSGYGGNRDCFTVWVRMPDKWKIVSAQLKTDQMIIEFNRGKITEKQIVPFSLPFKGLSDNILFRGTNRLDGLTLFHFTTEEDPMSAFTPHLAKSKVTKGFRLREAYAIFRTSNWLMLHYSIEETNSSKRSSRTKINPPDNFRLINDNTLHFDFNGKRLKRKIPIQDFLEPHEEMGSSSEGSSFWGDELRWTRTIEIVSEQMQDR